MIDGSYNWSKSAKYNEKHIIVVESQIIARMYKENFDRLIRQYNNSKNILVS